MIKKCGYCQKEKSLSEFRKGSKYYDSYCNNCKLIYKRLNYKKVVFDIPNIDNELWVDVSGFEGVYQVSNFGRIKSLKRESFGDHKKSISEKLLKIRISIGGYGLVWLRSGNVGKGLSVHRLVCLSFIPNLDNKKEVNHKDGNKLNNHISNLEWVTPSENQIHAYSIGLRKNKKGSKYKAKQNIKVLIG